VLLADVGDDRDAALLAGAVRSHHHRHPAFVRDRQRLEQTLAAVRRRLGEEATDAASAEGARMSLPEALAAARQLIPAAGSLAPPSGPEERGPGGPRREVT
jgi:hypothetical protein